MKSVMQCLIWMHCLTLLSLAESYGHIGIKVDKEEDLKARLN